jgi:hypothetical protein
MPSPEILTQVGLALGFIGVVLLACSNKIGVISKGGSTIFTGLDPMEPAEKNLKRVRASHWRNRYLMPLGWVLVAASFLLQFVASIR